MPGLAGDNRIELPAGRVPGFERRYVNLDPEPPRQVGHPCVGLHPEHPAAGRLELPGGDCGTAADVEDAWAGAADDDPVHHGVGIAGPGPVVAFGIRAERLRYLSAFMRLVFGVGRRLRRYSGHVPTNSGHMPTRQPGGPGRRDARCQQV